MFSHLQAEIASQFLRNAGTEVELEARFGEFRGKEFITGVSFEEFQRIDGFFSTNMTPILQYTTDYIRDNIRKTVKTPNNPDEMETVTWLRKTRIWNHDVPDYNLRLSMAREENIDPVPDFEPTYTRIKNRRSYIIFDGAVRVDLTMVEQKYEVEVELLNRQAMPQFERGIKVILQKILNTLELYTNREANNLITYINGILGSQRRFVIDHYPLVQARDLNLKDMNYGGLIGNPNTIYTVTHKADGERKLLVFHETGIWLVMAPHRLNKILNLTVPQLYGTIIDGEEIPIINRKEGAPVSKYWFLAFDCMARMGDANIQKQPHKERMKFCQIVTNYISSIQYPSEKSRILTMNTKDFKQFVTVEDFYALMNRMFDEQNLLAYKQDGFMFTPADTIYNNGTEALPLYKRVLTNEPDICKWKPKEKLSIDFLIRWGRLTPEGKRTLELFSGNLPGQGENLVPFKGSYYNPYDVTAIDTENILTLNVPNNTIVEYAWDYENNFLYPIRIRYEKTRPNRVDRAENIWDHIHNPIEASTLKGEDFTLVYAYHNRIKRGIYKYALLDGGKRPKTLIDIGSGRGGTVSSWKEFDKIIAVEPNEEHIKELRRRIELQHLTDKVMVLHCGGEDTATITAAAEQFFNGKADIISMMLSMSFFWRNRETFEALVNTIKLNLKSNGKFIFLTIDGDAVQQLFDPMFNGPQFREFRMGPATLTYDPPQLDINLPGTIVGEQREWLVRLSDFLFSNFNLIELHRADGERFLNEQEKLYTKMYSFGALSPQTEITKNMPKIPVTVPVQTPKPLPRFNIGAPEFTPIPTIPTAVSPRVPAITVPTIVVPTIPTVPRTTSPRIPTVMVPQIPISPRIPTIPVIPRATSPRIPVTIPQIPIIPSVIPKTPPQIPNIPNARIIAPQIPNIPTLPIISTLSTIPTLPHIPKLQARPVPLPTFAPMAALTSPPMIKREPTPVASIFVSKPRIAGSPGANDDTYLPMVVPWFDNVIRIAAIGDGSCFFHAVLKAYFNTYQNNPSYAFRTDFVAKLRRDLAYLLQLPAGEAASPEITVLKQELSTMTNKPLGEVTYYDNAANGAFIEFYMQQLQGHGLTDDDGVILDFSLAGMQRLFNSYRDVGYEVYQYVADILGVDIFVTIGYTDNLKPFINTQKPNREPRPIIIIVGNKHHYEVIGIRTPEGIRTVFENDDPFIQSLKQQRA